MRAAGAEQAEAISSETELAGLALGLIGGTATLTAAEQKVAARVVPISDPRLAALRARILVGNDPLGEAFARLRPPEQRRDLGATYTPPAIVAPMLAWAAREAAMSPIQRVIDPGAGTGRFLIGAAKHFPDAALVGIEIDPLAALLLRANFAVLGLTARSLVLVADYREAEIPAIEGCTLFIGNPPYLRHHGIHWHWKAWYAETARRFGIKASRLAGLHLHFFLRTLELAQPGDLGCFVTAAEWLDVNYGQSLRALLAGPLGGLALHRLDSKALPFDDAVTTGVVACFRVGANPETLRYRNVTDAAMLGDLSAGDEVSRAMLAAAPRWTLISRPGPAVPPGWIELGEICRVHRGQVTGGNAVWIAGARSAGVPERFLSPAITKARELLAAATTLDDATQLRRVIDLPRDLAVLSDEEREGVMAFLDWAKAQGADRSYIAQHRPSWWSVGLRAPAPILCTYMARRPPVFVRNLCCARNINIAHGLYPRQPLPAATLDALAAWLRAHVAQSSGRTYAGGLTKFEPKELERVAVPPLEELPAISASGAGV